MNLHLRRKAPIVQRVRMYGYTVGRCVYCGRHVTGFVCGAHADLVRHDPLMLAAGLPAVSRRV